MFLMKLLLLSLICTLAVSNEYYCEQQINCANCLTANINCAWCTDEKYDSLYRCLTRNSLLKAGCSEDRIYYNQPIQIKEKNLNLSDYDAEEGSAIQVQPQNVFLKLVKSNTEHIQFTFRPAKNYPLELYVLMDLTWSMRDDKDTLVRLGADLSGTLRNLTENYRLGFGSYADKPAMPMSILKYAENPCAPVFETCVPTYTFKHHLSLTNDINSFVQVVNASKITANLDNLEGGLEALMQVAVCPERVGWTEKARKVVILVTDGYLHSAGDGILAGIVKPNQKKCAIDEHGALYGELLQDYPSLEEIYREIVKRKISVIFAVTSDVVSTYKQYSFLMKGMSNVEILRADSSNILDLIRNSYESFTKRTTFNDNSPPYIDIQYYTDCGGQFSVPRKTKYCNNIEKGKKINFYLNVTLLEYPEKDISNLTIRIEEATLNQFLELNVEIQKPCPCAEKGDQLDEYSRFQCSENGYLECGSCICDKNWTGLFCSCPVDPTNSSVNDAMENFCKQPINSTIEFSPICSDHGGCECGECYCDEGFEGKYCECPQCGPDCDLEKADCVCGKCMCKHNWSGKNCICKTSNDGCEGPSGEICSGRGHCDCGNCICDSPFKGSFCEVGFGSENTLCTFYEQCVICLIEQQLGEHFYVCENITEMCKHNLTDEPLFSYTYVTEPIDADVICLVRLKNKHEIICDHFFTYQSFGQLENYLLIQANICDPVSYSQILGSVFLLTFIIGMVIIFLIWLFIRAKDEREFSRFKADQAAIIQNMSSNMSPLYKNPISEYTVPLALSKTDENPFS